MSTRIHFLLSGLSILVLVCMAAGPVHAQGATTFRPSDAIAELERLENSMREISQDDQALQALRLSIQTYSDQGDVCAAEVEPEIASLRSELEILGEPVPDEEIDIWEQRREVTERLSVMTARRSNCELLEVRADNLIVQIDAVRNRMSAQRMWSRGPSLLTELGVALAALRTLPDTDAIGMEWQSRFDTSLAVATGFAVLLAGFAIYIGLRLRRRFDFWVRWNRFDQGPPRLAHLLLRPAAENAPLILGGIALSLVAYAAAREPSLDLFAQRAALGPILFGLGVILIRWSTNKLSPAMTVPGLAPDHIPGLRARMRACLAVLVVGFVLLGLDWLGDPPDTALLFVYMLLNLLLAGCLLAVVLLARQVSGMRNRFRALRLLVSAALLLSVGAGLTGYYNFANYLLLGVLISLFAAFLLWLSLWMTNSIIAAVSKGGTPLTYRVRTWFGLSDSDPQSGLGIYNLVIDLILWFGFMFGVVNAWDTSDKFPGYVAELVTDGFQVGTVRIIPIHIVYGLLAFVGILIATGWVKRSVQRRYIKHTRMDRGARDALLKITGYVGFVVAALIGLKLTGISFAGLAIVAGALSVGIGFGLQNIVNNFVSGLILLFERPIKSGDFVTVGGVEGTVKAISIRSTEIETLDRQNVIVPNSELVSQQVTNWVLHDPHGRLQLNVGVAYGSDVEKVREVLRITAENHPQVLTDGVNGPKPKVLFMGFGDSSLDFELRIWIRQIRQRFDVTSDLNFAIERAFRENNIEIPFPQRDLHVRSWSESAGLPGVRDGD